MQSAILGRVLRKRTLELFELLPSPLFRFVGFSRHGSNIVLDLPIGRAAGDNVPPHGRPVALALVALAAPAPGDTPEKLVERVQARFAAGSLADFRAVYPFEEESVSAALENKQPRKPDLTRVLRAEGDRAVNAEKRCPESVQLAGLRASLGGRHRSRRQTKETTMPMQKYLFIQRSQPDHQPGARPQPSPAEMQQMFDAFNAWKEKFKAEILDLGGKLRSGGKILTSAGVTDGPFVEGKEIVGGFMIVAAESYERALEVARESPGLRPGSSIEIRELAGP